VGSYLIKNIALEENQALSWTIERQQKEKAAMTRRNVRDLRAAADAIINSYDAAARLEAMAALEVFSPAERIGIAGFVRNAWGGLGDTKHRPFWASASAK
jgi:hypothetical protein